MNTLQIEGNWNIIKGKLKKQYASLTDNDLVYVEGKEDEFIGRIQRALGRTRDEVISLINGIARSSDQRSSDQRSSDKEENPVTPDRDIEGSDEDIDETTRQRRPVNQNR